MEGESSDDSGAMPFAWAPGWNSNQAISQFQQEVGEELIAQETQLFIDFNEYDISELNSDDEITQSDRSNTFTLQKPWYKGDWQANLTPEFTLMKNANSVFMSEKMIEQNNWQQGQWLAVKISLDNLSNEEAVATIAQVNCDDRITDDLVYGDMDLPIGTKVSRVEFSVATEQQKQDYQQVFNHAQQEALDQKALILKRLKVQDQTIPIRLVSGGLDDA